MFTKSAVLVTLSLFTLTLPLTVLAQVATTTATTTAAVDPHNSADVASAVAAYFADIPVMVAIAKCESDFIQLNSSGGVLNGGSGGMLGVFQINRSVHAKFALSIGDDISTLEGNLAYARYLYNQEGTAPWDSSKSCWGDVPLPAAASSTLAVIADAILPTVVHAAMLPASVATSTASKKSVALTQTVKIGSTGPQVVALQKLLNAAGFIIAKTGAGSPGHEGSTFGTATLSALERFQCVHNIACKGTPSTTGYGAAGAKTRAALMLNS